MKCGTQVMEVKCSLQISLSKSNYTFGFKEYGRLWLKSSANCCLQKVNLLLLFLFRLEGAWSGKG